MIGRRAGALDGLDARDADDTTLLLEWSAPRTCALEDRQAWRQASPHWSARRERVIAKRLDAALAGESDDADEPDPVESFRTQWLNQWPAKRVAVAKGDPLLETADWSGAFCPDDSDGPLVIGVEDNRGRGAAVAFVGALADGRWVVGGFLCANRADAYRTAAAAAMDRPGSTLIVGASLAADPELALMPVLAVKRAGQAETGSALTALRDLLTTGQVCQDGSVELVEQVAQARVMNISTGLSLVTGPRSDLLRAAIWALRYAATEQMATPAIH